MLHCVVLSSVWKCMKDDSMQTPLLLFKNTSPKHNNTYPRGGWLRRKSKYLVKNFVQYHDLAAAAASLLMDMCVRTMLVFVSRHSLSKIRLSPMIYWALPSHFLLWHIFCNISTSRFFLWLGRWSSFYAWHPLKKTGRCHKISSLYGFSTLEHFLALSCLGHNFHNHIFYATSTL